MSAKSRPFAVREKIHSAKTNAAIPWIFFRRSKGVGDICAIRSRAALEETFGHDWIGPARHAPFGIGNHLRFALEHGCKSFLVIGRTFGNHHLEEGSLNTFWNLEQN